MSGMREMGARMFMGTWSCSQRFQRGFMRGPRIQSPEALAAGLRRTPRMPAWVSSDRCSGASGLSGLTRQTPSK